MSRRNPTQLQFDALSLEGAILPPEWLGKVAALEAVAQAPADYDIPKGLQLRDEVGRYWRIAQAVWADFAAARTGNDSVGAANRITRDMLTQVFGFSDLAPAGERVVSGRPFPIAFEALGGRVPVVVGPPTESLDQNVPRHGDGTRRRSAWGVLQEYLNASDDALWGITTNGLCLRLGRDNASLTRPAWLEADLERIFGEERFADFSVLWLLLHASRFGRADQPVQEAPLERWREAGREEGSRARDALRVGVEDALRTLGQGFVAHPLNTELRAALASGELSPGDYFNELLRLVYRMIFLLTVEERGILHLPGADADAASLYATGYGLRRLRERSVRHSAHDRHGDLWASLRPVFAGLARAEGEPALGLPGLGGLFAADQCSHLDTAALENRALLTAVFRLAWLREGDALARVNWKDMGVEEFGSVYESLLDLTPTLRDGGRQFDFADESESAENARKLTGSYYTPDALVQQLLDTALEPVVAERLVQHPDPSAAAEALLSLAVVDPACGSGHFLLAAARRLAGHLARVRAGGTPGAVEYRHALRDVATHCIHGVDRNPMALELARMALWLEAYTADRALGFLDHHLVCGDALLGVLDLDAVKDGIPDEAFKALAGDDKEVAKLLTKLNRTARRSVEAQRKKGQLSLALGTEKLAAEFERLDALDDGVIDSVAAKRARFDTLREEAQRSAAALAADLFVGAFLMNKRLGEGERALTEQQAAGRYPTTATLSMALEGTLATTHAAALAARAACADARVLHWRLAFPQIFARGGFDVVLGNPPWEQLEVDQYASLSEQEGATRAQCFFTESGRFPLTSKGRKNLYALFVESVLKLCAPNGRAGLVVPTGVVTDQPSEELCRSLIGDRRLVSLFDFENQGRHFSAVHRQQRFALVTLAGVRSSVDDATYAFDLENAGDAKDRARSWVLSAADIQKMSPARFSVPMFRKESDASLAAHLYRQGITMRELEGTRWHISSGLLYNADQKSKQLRARYSNARTQDSFPADWVRVYEGTFFNSYDHRFAYSHGAEIETSTDEQKSDPAWVPWTEYVMPSAALERWSEVRGAPPQWYVAMRRQARVSDAMTSIAAVLPCSVAEGNTSVFWGPGAEGENGALLCASLNSLVFNYVLRLRQSGANVSKSIYEQIPLPKLWLLEEASDARAAILRIAGALSFTSNILRSFADDLGLSNGPTWQPTARHQLRCELEARVFALFKLDRAQVERVLDTFPVLQRREELNFREYRTRRLVLEAWDRLFGA